eukprot:g272.t1
MSQADLQRMENLCQRVFNSQDPRDQGIAQAELVSITDTPQFIPKCQYIFENSTNNYALMVAAKSLTKLVTTHWNNFTSDGRVDIRNFVLSYMANRGSAVEPFVLKHLVVLVCRITKLGWFDDPRHRDLVKEVTKFLQATIEHCIIGLRLLNELVQDMNRPLPGQSLTDHRKASVSFRDACLFHMFQVSLTTIRQIQEHQIRNLSPENENKMKEQALTLGINAMSFDFIGTNPDEATSEVGTIQIPASWRKVVQDPATLQLLFDVYQANKAPRSAQALELIMHMAAVRRSVFSNDQQRRLFLGRLMEGIRGVLVTQHGLSDAENYHQFCRLLGKLKSNYQLSELVNTEGYASWIELAAQFTINSFEQWRWSSRSTHYLLQLWARLISATPYAKVEAGKQGHSLQNYTSDILKAYFKGRLQAIDASLRTQTVENPLEDPGTIDAQLTHLPNISRYEYAKIGSIVSGMFEPLLAQYREGASVDPSQLSPQDAERVVLRMNVLEGQLAWMVHVVAALVGGQTPLLNKRSKTDSKEEFVDADLCRLSFNLLNFVDNRMNATNGAAKPDVYLELALLQFCREFRKCYVGEHRGMPSLTREQMRSENTLSARLQMDVAGGSSTRGDDSNNKKSDSSMQMESKTITAHIVGLVSSRQTEKTKMYLRMFERMQMGDYKTVINSIIKKLGNNLRFWTTEEEIVDGTLKLFSNFVTGYSSGHLLLQLDTVKYILTHHTAEYFPFMAEAQNLRHRSTFYKMLARLIWMHDGPAHFEVFMSSFVHLTMQLHDAIKTLQPNQPNESARLALIGVCRDLRGVAEATHNNRTFEMLFDSLYPNVFPALIRAADVWAHDPMVTTAIFRFMCELVFNKANRVMFDHCSANGILLFRETSKIAVAFSRRIITKETPKDDRYKLKYKGMGLALTMLARALGGRYVNFGVFSLYGDRALDAALEASLFMALSIPMQDLLEFPKLSKAVYTYLAVIFRNHIDVVLALDNRVFMQLINTLTQGLQSLQDVVSSLSAAAMDHLATYHFRNSRKETQASRALSAHLRMQPSLFGDWLAQLLKVVLFTNSGCTNQWALGKPVLSIILADDKAFQTVRQQLAATQKAEDIPLLERALEKLVCDIRPNLEQGNRDRFSQQLAVFRREVMRFWTS